VFIGIRQGTQHCYYFILFINLRKIFDYLIESIDMLLIETLLHLQLVEPCYKYNLFVRDFDIYWLFNCAHIHFPEMSSPWCDTSPRRPNKVLRFPAALSINCSQSNLFMFCSLLFLMQKKLSDTYTDWTRRSKKLSYIPILLFQNYIQFTKFVECEFPADFKNKNWTITQSRT
jgi:hypothetical protein